MTRKRNREVIQQFVRDGPDAPNMEGHGNVHVTGGVLYSYRKRMANWVGREQMPVYGDDTDATDERWSVLVVHAGLDGYSKTTSTHFYHLYSAILAHEPVVEIANETGLKSRWRDLRDERETVGVDQ